MSDTGCDTKAACGYGYDGMCCCECALQLVDRPKCHHLGGPGQCLGPHPEPDEETGYVCLAFAGSDGVAQTSWSKHGCCEVWTPKEES